MNILHVLILFVVSAATAFSQGAWSLRGTLEKSTVLLHSIDGVGDTCIVAGAIGSVGGYSPLLARSTDGGATWSKMDHGQTNSSEWEVNTRINYVKFLDPSTVIAVGGGGMILRSTDAGTTWNRSESPTLFPLGYASFSDSLTGIVGSDYALLGMILRTVDGGVTWDTAALPSGYASYDVACLSRSTFIVVGDDDTLMRTTDAGASWSFVKTGADRSMRILFQDSLVGWLYGLGPTDLLLRTTDGGLTWNEALKGPGAGILFLSFCDRLNGIAVRYIGTIGYDRLFIRTTDGGETWESMDAPYAMRLDGPVSRGLSYVRPNLAYGASLGSVSRYLDDGTPILRQPRFVGPDVVEAGLGASLEPVWYSVPEATGYDVQIARQFAGGSSGGTYDTMVYATTLLLDRKSQSDTSALLDSSLVEYTRYYCRVRSIDETGTYAPSDWNEQFFFVPKTSGVGSEESAEESGMRAYPQPASGNVLIHLARTVGSRSVDLYDMTGRAVATAPIVAGPDGSGTATFDIGALSSGIYWVVLRGTGGVGCPVVVR